MTEAVTDSAGLNGPVSEAPKPKKRTAASTTRATKKVAEKAPEVKNVQIEAQEEDISNEVITAPKPARAPRKSNVKTDDNNTIGSNAADVALESVENNEPEDKSEEKVAVWSRKNMRWAGVGSLTSGYNIVTKEAAEKWYTLNGVREATPEEIATFYGK